MSNMIKTFPSYLHLPLQIIIFDPDEATIFIIAMSLALIFGGFFYVLWIVIPYFYRKIKKKNPRGFFRHLSYFSGLTGMKGYPSYFEKEFLE